MDHSSDCPFDAVDAALAVLSVDGTIQRANASFTLTLSSGGDLRGQRLRELLREADRERADRALACATPVTFDAYPLASAAKSSVGAVRFRIARAGTEHIHVVGLAAPVGAFTVECS
jgi:hypothetical protein